MPPVHVAVPQHPAPRATDGSHAPPALRQQALPPSPLFAQRRPSVQHPGAGLPGEQVAPSPIEHTAMTTHEPLAHIPDGQTVPQRPQLDESDCESTHRSPHAVRPAGHAQTPPLQACAAGHERPHAPQLATSVVASMHLPPQMMRGEAQPDTHAPFMHVSPAVQLMPQPPQFVGSLCVLAQRPRQSVCDPGHDGPRSIGEPASGSVKPMSRAETTSGVESMSVGSTTSTAVPVSSGAATSRGVGTSVISGTSGRAPASAGHPMHRPKPVPVALHVWVPAGAPPPHGHSLTAPETHAAVGVSVGPQPSPTARHTTHSHRFIGSPSTRVTRGGRLIEPNRLGVHGSMDARPSRRGPRQLQGPRTAVRKPTIRRHSCASRGQCAAHPGGARVDPGGDGAPLRRHVHLPLPVGGERDDEPHGHDARAPLRRVRPRRSGLARARQRTAGSADGAKAPQGQRREGRPSGEVTRHGRFNRAAGNTRSVGYSSTGGSASGIASIPTGSTHTRPSTAP